MDFLNRIKTAFSEERLSSHRYVLGFFLVLAVSYTFPLILNLNQLPFDPTLDTFLFSWSLWWFKHCVITLQNPLVSDMIFYPHEANLSMATLSLPYAIAAFPVLLVFGDFPGIPIAFNLIILGSFTLTGYFAYVLARELSLSSRAAFFAGVFYTFSGQHVENRERFHIFCLEMVMLCLLFSVRLLRLDSEPWKRTVKVGAMLGVSVALLAYTSQTYSLHYVLQIAILGVGVLVARKADLFNARVFTAGAVSVLVCLVLVLPLAYYLVQFFGEDRVEDFQPLNPDILRFVTPNGFLTLYRELGFTLHNQNFLGYLAYAFAIAGFSSFRPPKTVGGRWPWFIMALVGFVFALGTELNFNGKYTGITMPLGWVHDLLPFLKTDRAPDRYFALAVIVLCIVAGLGVERLLQLPRLKRYASVAPPVILVLILVELHWPAFGRFHPNEALPVAHDHLGELVEAEQGDLVVLSLPPRGETKHPFYLQIRTGAAIMDADYPRLSPLMGYRFLKKEGLYDVLNDPEDSFGNAGAVARAQICQRLLAAFDEGNIRAAYVYPTPDSPFADWYGGAERLLAEERLLRECVPDDRYVIEPRHDTLIRSVLFLFPGEDAERSERFLDYAARFRE